MGLPVLRKYFREAGSPFILRDSDVRKKHLTLCDDSVIMIISKR